MGNSSSAEEGLDDSINISHFKLLDVIGQGGFGKVRMIQKKDTKKKYALKYINKKFCIQKNAVEHIFRERILLEEISHPFITNLKFAFQDDEHMFMVLDLAVGGDLKYHLDQIGAFTERSVKLYAAEITCALIYLHSNSIIHRFLLLI
jgi:serine/threonine kinase 32